MFKEYDVKKDKFDNLIRNYFEEKNILNEALNYAIYEGKRVRPIILLEIYKMLSGNDWNKTSINLAIALEFIHNYSLVHDDLPAMDNDDYRRGRETVHKKYREDLAILAGDGLLNSAYELMLNEIVSAQNIDEVKNVAKASKSIAIESGINGMIKGQIIDVFEVSKSREDILEMYTGKTCGLIIAATTAAAYLSGMSNEIIKEMHDLGLYIGLAFQLQDDLLDIEQDDDINKLTYITFSDVDETKEKIDYYTEKANEILNKYDNNDFMLDLTNYLVKRKF